MFRFTAQSMVVLTYLVGSTSLLAFTIFLFLGPLNLFPFSLSEPAKLAIDASLCLVFFIQHSTMIRKTFRNGLMKHVGAHYHGALFTITSGVLLFGLVLLWQKSSLVLWQAHGVFYWLLRVIFILSIGGMHWGIKSLGSFDAFGIATIIRHSRSKHSPSSGPLVVKGPYRWVRHPLYFFSLLMFWSHPVLSADRLLFNILWTGWIIVGILLEERDMVAYFGDAYREYQSKVPMFVPLRLPLRLRSTSQDH